MKVPVESDIIVNFGVAFYTFVISRLKLLNRLCVLLLVILNYFSIYFARFNIRIKN
jgi:hypothetical protein